MYAPFLRLRPDSSRSHSWPSTHRCGVSGRCPCGCMQGLIQVVKSPRKCGRRSEQTTSPGGTVVCIFRHPPLRHMQASLSPQAETGIRSLQAWRHFQEELTCGRREASARLSSTAGSTKRLTVHHWTQSVPLTNPLSLEKSLKKF